MRRGARAFRSRHCACLDALQQRRRGRCGAQADVRKRGGSGATGAGLCRRRQGSASRGCRHLRCCRGAQPRFCDAAVGVRACERPAAIARLAAARTEAASAPPLLLRAPERASTSSALLCPLATLLHVSRCASVPPLPLLAPARACAVNGRRDTAAPEDSGAAVAEAVLATVESQTQPSRCGARQLRVAVH